METNFLRFAIDNDDNEKKIINSFFCDSKFGFVLCLCQKKDIDKNKINYVKGIAYPRNQDQPVNVIVRITQDKKEPGTVRIFSNDGCFEKYTHDKIYSVHFLDSVHIEEFKKEKSTIKFYPDFIKKTKKNNKASNLYDCKKFFSAIFTILNANKERILKILIEKEKFEVQYAKKYVQNLIEYVDEGYQNLSSLTELKEKFEETFDFEYCFDYCCLRFIYTIYRLSENYVSNLMEKSNYTFSREYFQKDILDSVLSL